MSSSRVSFFPATWRASARSDDDSGGRAARSQPATSDEVLIRRVAAGDDTAFAEIVARYERRLAQFVRWSLDEAGDLADDVLQEVFLQVHCSARRFAGESSFRTWLYALARNVCRHEARKLRRQPAWVAESEDALIALPDVKPGPLETLAQEQAIQQVRRAVDALPSTYRLVLLLRDWEDLSYIEMARVLDVPVGTIRSRLHNARALLSERLIAEASK